MEDFASSTAPLAYYLNYFYLIIISNQLEVMYLDEV